MAVQLLRSPSSSPEDGLSRLARLARNRRLEPEAQNAYGYALLLAGRYEEAAEWIWHAVKLNPKVSAYHTNLSAALHRLGQMELAFAHTREAHALDPKNLKAMLNVGAFHYWLGEIPDAVDWFERAIELDPSSWKAWWMWLYMLDFTSISAEDALAARRKFNEAHQIPLKRYWGPHTNTPDPDKKIRLGLTGGDFRQHSGTYFWGLFFEHLDRERFEIYAYAHISMVDALTDWFRKGSEQWADITLEEDDRVIAEQIRRDRVDVLMDMGTFSDNSHLMAHLYKPAPLSITAWGHLTGTGLDCMDALLIDPIMVPPDREWEMTEQPLRVPYALGWYQPKPHHQIALQPRPERPLTFGYLGRVQKLDNPTVALWADLLHVYPESRLLMKDAAYAHERVVTRLLERFEAWGIGPERLEIRGPSSRGEHLETYNDVDVALDPLSQGSGTTTLEAFDCGVPTVTLRGERLVRRVSASTVTVTGHPEYVAESAAEYIEIAGRIAKDRGQALREQFYRSHICDGAARTRAFEDAVRDLWRQWCLKQTA